MTTKTTTYQTITGLRAALPDLPEDAVIRDCDGDWVNDDQVSFMQGTFAPYTVTHEVPDTPAPLDPSKVKAGDTVALEREGVTVRGKAGTQRSLGILTAVFISGVGTLYFRDGWTLTDHQPAPELEVDTPAPLDPSAVKAGDMVTLKGAPATYASSAPAAKVEGMVREVLPDGRIAIHGVQVFFFPSALTDHQPAPEPEVDTLAETIWETADTDDVEPLSKIAADKMAAAIRAKFVVIDPAKVDVDALMKATSAAYRTSPWGENAFEAAAKAALKFLGLEAS